MEVYDYRPEDSDLIIGLEEDLAWDQYLDSEEIRASQRERIQLGLNGLLELDTFRAQDAFNTSLKVDNLLYDEDFESDEFAA